MQQKYQVVFMLYKLWFDKVTFIGPVLNVVTVVTCERAVTNLINGRGPALRGELANVELSLFGARRNNETVWLDQLSTTEDCRLDQRGTTEETLPQWRKLLLHRPVIMYGMK